MVNVYFVFDEDREYLGFQVSGHAGYADEGHDVVCAAVSAVSLGTASAIFDLLDTPAVYEMGEKGLLLLKFEEKPDYGAKLLFKAMINTMENIAKQYSEKFLKIRYVQKLGNGNYILLSDQEV